MFFSTKDLKSVSVTCNHKLWNCSRGEGHPSGWTLGIKSTLYWFVSCVNLQADGSGYNWAGQPWEECWSQRAWSHQWQWLSVMPFPCARHCGMSFSYIISADSHYNHLWLAALLSSFAEWGICNRRIKGFAQVCTVQSGRLEFKIRTISSSKCITSMVGVVRLYESGLEGLKEVYTEAGSRESAKKISVRHVDKGHLRVCVGVSWLLYSGNRIHPHRFKQKGICCSVLFSL